MQRLKKHKVKKEMPEASTSSSRKQDEHDLTHYIHDRVELMHQVFSMLKSKEIKMLAPECVRHISMDNLQELCTEELLGISSKRLHAILDGAEPPSDTESSSQSPSPQLETISLDSISSDEEILSQHSGKKKKHKHRRRNSKKKSKEVEEDDADKSKASRAGLTVLELLELQARARAIRAQLHQEQALKRVSESAVQSDHNSSENEVEIKEEPAEVVEISSDEEKPRVEELERLAQPTPKPTEQTSPKPAESQTKTVTRKVNDLIITVPQTKTTKKIKLNRNSINPVTVSKDIEKNDTGSNEATTKQVTVSIENLKKIEKAPIPVVDVQKKSRKKKKKKMSKVEEVDNDEITLQLSDSEKMDLLENLERRKASSSEDSASSSDTESENSDNLQSNSLDKSTVSRGKGRGNKKEADTKDLVENSNIENTVQRETNDNNIEVVKQAAPETTVDECVTDKELSRGTNEICSNTQLKDDDLKQNVQSKDTQSVVKSNDQVNKETEDNVPTCNANNVEFVKRETEMKNNSLEIATVDDIPLVSNEKNNDINKSDDTVVHCTSVEETTTDIPNKQALSEGEVTDRDSSEVEAVDLKPEVVCMTGVETEKKRKHKKEKKTKKEKKSKKEKKNKPVKSDFREGADQNFYKNNFNENGVKQDPSQRIIEVEEYIILDDDELEEILELSDDSSCYEVEGTVLSKEPTADEIEALSAKIDEIEREDVVTQEQIIEYERSLEEKKCTEDIEHISWKDRYLDSKKVRNILITSNIFNAMRKKNKELRKKISEANRIEDTKKTEEEVEIVLNLKQSLEEGSIEHYNTLQGSTKYVDPVEEVTKTSEIENIEKDGESASEGKVTREMKKDAKQLLKMYKKLLKYNDMERKRDPMKRKKKKHKSKNKDGDVSGNQEKNIIEERTTLSVSS